jgi:hypothetical protein
MVLLPFKRMILPQHYRLVKSASERSLSSEEPRFHSSDGNNGLRAFCELAFMRQEYL